MSLFASLTSYGNWHLLPRRDKGSHAAQRSMFFPALQELGRDCVPNFQVLFQRKESREPCLTFQGLDHCQAPPTQEGTWLHLGLRLLLHSLWGITLSRAAPSVPTASPDLGWARLWRTSEGQFSSSSDLGPAEGATSSWRLITNRVLRTWNLFALDNTNSNRGVRMCRPSTSSQLKIKLILHKRPTVQINFGWSDDWSILTYNLCSIRGYD